VNTSILSFYNFLVRRGPGAGSVRVVNVALLVHLHKQVDTSPTSLQLVCFAEHSYPAFVSPPPQQSLSVLLLQLDGFVAGGYRHLGGGVSVGFAAIPHLPQAFSAHPLLGNHLAVRSLSALSPRRGEMPYLNLRSMLKRLIMRIGCCD